MVNGIADSAPHWHSTCILSSRVCVPSKGEVPMKSKSKLIAAILGLGLTMVIPGAVIAQNPDDQTPDQYSKPSAGIQAQVTVQGPNDQGSMDQDAIDQGPMDQGS